MVSWYGCVGGCVGRCFAPKQVGGMVKGLLVEVYKADQWGRNSSLPPPIQHIGWNASILERVRHARMSVFWFCQRCSGFWWFGEQAPKQQPVNQTAAPA
mmetsp:Transcript_12474/g.29770  ORF Transcript_12474/g.29770 Transcript_12474/m.29770 type:complete len:99 (-) Transcript_12474:1358-1654(-)